jgi:hypothetical protein
VIWLLVLTAFTLCDWYMSFGYMALDIDAEDVRLLFGDLPHVKPTKLQNHSHPFSAADRNTAVAFAQMLAGLLKTRVYMHQMSKSDQRNGLPGSRVAFWERDLTVEERPFEPEPRDLIVDVDTVYYLTPEEVAEMVNSTSAPILLAVFCPQQAARGHGEFSYRFEGDKVVYEVTGGATYSHQLYDWSSDTYTFTYCGVTTTCNVDRRPLGDSDCHQLILLSPSVRYYGTFPRELEGQRLRRLEPIVGETVTLSRQTKMGRRISVARVGNYLSADVSVYQFEQAMLLCRANAGKVSAGILKSTIKENGVEMSIEIALVLVDILRVNSKLSMARVVPPSESVSRYQIGEVYDFDAKQSMTPFMSALVLGATAPDVCEANEQAAVKGRIFDVRNVDNVVSSRLVKQMVLFVQLLLRGVGKLHPVSRTEVRDRRSRPTQVANDRREDTAAEPKLGAKSFVKRETYPAPNDPRMIQPLGSAITVEYACYVYALEAVFRRCSWYSPGRTPAEIAESVCRVLADKAVAVMGDFSRMDGRIGIISRLLWQMFMMSAFDVQYASDLGENIRRQFATFARGSFNVKYFTGFSRLSGSMETTDANSLVTAFVVWNALCMDGLDPILAMDRFVVNGDDSICGDVSEKSMLKSSKLVGMVLEYTCVSRNCAGANYLNRIYGPGVFHGDTNSMIDVARALPKFGIATACPAGVTEQDKARDKAFAYSLGDAHTPILGAFCRKLLDELGAPSKRLGLGPFVDSVVPNEQYPNQYAEWMLTYVIETLPGFDWRLFELWIASGRAMLPPLCCDLTKPAKRTGFVDGQLVFGAPYLDNDVLARADARAEVEALADILAATYIDVNDPESVVDWLDAQRGDSADYTLGPIVELEELRLLRQFENGELADMPDLD